MEPIDFFSDAFALSARAAGLNARQRALAAGHPVVYQDDAGRFVQELPDGRKLEIRFRPGAPRESHIEVLGPIGQAVK